MQGELENNADSVNYLITQLCCSIARQHSLDPTAAAAAVHKLKSQSFEILLKKSTRPHVYSAPGETDEFDVQRALEVHVFAAKLHACGDPKLHARFAKFEQQLTHVYKQPYFTDGAGRGVLQLLLELQGNVCKADEVPIIRPPMLLVPGPFTLFANYERNRHYPTQQQCDWMHPKPRFFKGVHDSQADKNPYLPNYAFDNAYNKLAEIDRKYAPSVVRNASSAQDCTFTAMTRRLLGAGVRVNLNTFRLFGECGGGLLPRIQPNLHLKLNKAKESPESGNAVAGSGPVSDEEPRILSWNWESFGCFGIHREKPCTSEANVTLDLECYKNKMEGRPFVAKILTTQQFLKDLKALTAGLQSDTFYHDKCMIFDMQEHITVEGLLPDSIRGYAVDFLECGTCYKRLQTMIMKRDHKLMFDGFIFRALCSAIDEYLLTFRQYIFAQHDEHLMQFYMRMHKMMKQMRNLSYTLAIHPKVTASTTLPMGSQFLGYLYREIVRITDKGFIMLMVYILKRCCHVYFKHLQKWIYNGLLDDPCNELFINFVDHYRPNTKYFYDKAYSVRKDAVPGFFQTHEDQILQCGKYTMLLKTCKPDHPLFRLQYPAISVCLTFDDIEKLEVACEQYKASAQLACGRTAVSIRSMFEARAANKRQFYQRACQRSRENMDRWTDEQHALALLAAEQKKRRLDELTTQLQDAKQRKIAERRANVELELRLLRETERLEEQRMLRENINLRKRIEYYQELSDMMRLDAKDKATHVKSGSNRSGATQTQMSTVDSAAQPPQTPISAGTDTDFESCCGDDDSASLYAECISDEFVQRFEENEKELRAMCNEEEEASQNAGATKQEQAEKDSVIETSSDGSLYSAFGVVLDNNTLQAEASTTTFLKRSASDVINSNEIAATLPLSKISSTTITLVPAPLHVNTTEKPLTEAQRNKLRVLAHEFGTLAPSSTMPDINLNTLPDSELTDLQRNRRRMMQNDNFLECNTGPLADRAHMNLNLDTDRARNRRRVLESEFNIFTGQSASTTTFNVEPATTPMSTTSDTPITENASASASSVTAMAHKSDWENGNVLKINVELASEQQTEQENHKQHEEHHMSTATSARLPAETPECALNTAGLQAKQGFDFVDASRLQKQQQDAAHEAPIQPEQPPHEETVCPTVDYSQPYKRSMELIESNFKCATRTPFIRLNLTDTPQIVAARRSAEALKQLKLNSMSAITLTEFLQKSVILPMSTHFELVNNEVMRMFLEDLHVLDHLRSLRHYYFLMDGEFGSIICDGIIGKLESGAPPVKLLNYQMLHSILDTALGSSITGNEKNAENLSFIVSDMPSKFDISSPDVLDVLCLSYSIEWPLNLILNPETLEQYGNIFKYLLKVRRISWVLERAYQILKEAVKKNGQKLLKSPQYRHVQQIRHKFYHFVHALQNHITASALQASWKTFKDELLEAISIEDIYRKHTIYVKRILFLCMLNRHSAEFHNTIESIFKISLRFYNNLKLRDFKRRCNDEHYTHSRYEKLSNDEEEFDKFIKYTIYLGNKIVRHGYQEEIGEFINLINFNQYYTPNTNK